MKKIGLVILLLFAIVGCSQGEDTLSQDDLFLFDTETNEKIGIGMDRSEVDRILGNPTLDENQLFVVYDDVEIAYRKDEVVALLVRDHADERFETNRGITIGSSKDVLNRAYGQYMTEEDMNVYADPIITIERNEDDDGTFMLLGPDGKIDHENEDDLYELSFHTDEVNGEFRVNMIAIYDYVFGTRLR